MILQILLLVSSFVLLIKCADMFVDGAASVARNFKISKIVIGITIVAFGTSAPELAVSIKALMSNNGDMVLGNVIGSNIINILLIVGISCLFGKIRVKNNTIKKELPIVILMSILLITVFLDNIFDKSVSNFVSRSDGVVLLLFFSIFIYYLFSIIRNKKEADTEDEPSLNLKNAIIFSVLGLAGIIVGSNYVVESASRIASIIGVSDRMVALTVIALGTSLPELVTSIISVKKNEQDLLVGNIIGSNIFNIGLVLALPVSLFGGVSGIGFNMVDLVVLVLSAVMLLIFASNDKVITKKEGILLLSIFIIYYTYVIFGR